MSTQLISSYGEMWARNRTNLRCVPDAKKGGKGVYILYDGSMPMYVGMGNLRSRIRKAKNSRSRGQRWEHFSWYALSDALLMRDVEALLLRALPPALRSLTGQKGTLNGAKKLKQQEREAEPITRKLGAARKRRKR